jgi:hypothetical protein
LAAERKLTPMQALEDEMVEAVVTETGIKPDMARFIVAPIIRHLCSEYGGEQLYIPAIRKECPVEDVRAYFAESQDVDATCRRFSISRRTLYRIIGPSQG